MENSRKKKKNILYGYQSVKKALELGFRNSGRLFITQNKYQEVLEDECIYKYNNIIFYTNEELYNLTKSMHHNSIALEIDNYENSVSLNSLGPRILILDSITDSGNLGALIRSSAVFGYDIILPNHNSATINSVVGKNAAGGLEFVKIHYCNSLLQTVKNLKKEYYFIVGATEKNINIPSILQAKNKPEKICIIMGSEDKGIRNSLEKELDFTYTILGCNRDFNVLNVSVAAAIIMHALKKV